MWLGDGVPADPRGAVTQLLRACDQGRSAACAVAGMMLEMGQGPPRNIDRAQALLRESAGGELFDLGGCEEGAHFWTSGITSQDSACCRAARDCEEGCDAECHAALARIRAKTTDIVHSGCARGDALACYVEGLGLSFGFYAEGLGWVSQNGSGAAEALFDRACKAGLARGCAQEAVLIDIAASGPDRPARLKVADALDDRACAGGDGYGCYRVAQRIETRLGGSRTAAIPTYERACELGMRVVCTDLAAMYEKGEGVAADPAKAAQLAARARF